MKRTLIMSAVFLLSAAAYGQQQNLIVIKPEIGTAPDLSEKAQKEFEQRAKLIEKLNKGASADALTQKERELLDRYGESEDASIWDVMDQGCSWYCGGGPYRVSASSALKPSGGITYDAANAHDFSFKNAWVEGVPGYGVGEYLEYFFKNESPRVTQVNVYNGYLKSENGWKKNSRVKRLKLSVNGRPHAVLELQDTRALQMFKLNGPLGRTTNGKDLALKFEILEVYKGEAYDDTAITELFFDGLDVHCLAKGTRIATAEGERPIETISPGDRVLQYDPARAQLSDAVVTRVIKADHSHLFVLQLEDGSMMTATGDHPFWIVGKGWCAHQPGGAQSRRFGQYVIGDRFLLYDTGKGAREARLKEITKADGRAETYTLELRSGAGFLANGLISGIAHVKE